MVKTYLCNFNDCQERPFYGFSGKKETRCGKHREDGMINVLINRCQHEGCSKLPSFNYEGKNRKLYCSSHKLPQMINITIKRCRHTGCNKIPGYNFPDEKRGAYCSPHKKQGMVLVRKKICEYSECTNVPSFNLPGEKKGKYCSKHKIKNMVDVKHSICEKKGCSTQPTFNFPGEKKGIFCNIHKKDGMISMIGKRCEFKGCSTTPVFNSPGIAKGRFCSAHKQDGMVNIKDRTCKRKGCLKQPRFNLNGEKKGIYCAEHKKLAMIDVNRKVCEHENCRKRPGYNNPGEKQGKYCAEHKTLDMVDVAHRMCIADGCPTRPHFNIPGQIPQYCYQHRKSGMIANPSKRCGYYSCRELAVYGYDKPSHCEKHSLNDEENLIERECEGCHLVGVLGKDGICELCNPETFKRFRRAKEERVKQFLDAKGYKYVSHDKIIDGGVCGKERPDFLFEYYTHFVILEIDENQHSSKACTCEGDQARMVNISQSLGIPVWFIRYNPDNYRNKNGKKRIVGDSHNKRHQTLETWLKYCQKKSPIKTNDYIKVVYLYYDEWPGYGEEFTLQEWEGVVFTPDEE